MTGRPRKDGPRYPAGQLKPEVPPTPETIEHRRIVAGDKAADPRASYPLGILAIRGAITGTDHAAGLRFAALHQVVWGRRQPRSHLAQLVAGITGAAAAIDDPVREKRIREAAEQLGEAIAALKALPTSRPSHVLENIAVYDRPMRFMDTARARTPAAWAADQRDLEALQEATDALAKLWRMGHYAPKRAAD